MQPLSSSSTVNDPNTSTSSDPQSGEGFRISDQPIVRRNGNAAAGNGSPAQGRPNVPETDLLYVIARDPKSLFVYWDLNWKRLFAEAGLSPRQVHLRIYRVDGSVEGTQEINPFRGHCYADVATAGTGYYCELGCLDDGEWTSLVRSGRAATPEDQMSEDFSTQFATLPLHLSFQRMLDLLRGTPAEGAALAQSVADLQDEARVTPGANGATETPASDLNLLLQAPAAVELTAEERAQWRKLAEELAGAARGGSSAGGLGRSSPA
ncbi:hypothetical protein BH18VER2_BH18VER2_17140 [soil metagenome]